MAGYELAHGVGGRRRWPLGLLSPAQTVARASCTANAIIIIIFIRVDGIHTILSSATVTRDVRCCVRRSVRPLLGETAVGSMSSVTVTRAAVEKYCAVGARSRSETTGCCHTHLNRCLGGAIARVLAQSHPDITRTNPFCENRKPDWPEKKTLDRDLAGDQIFWTCAAGTTSKKQVDWDRSVRRQLRVSARGPRRRDGTVLLATAFEVQTL